MEFEGYKLQIGDKTNLLISRHRRAIRRLKAPFVRGPISLNWLQRAMKFGGTAISVGIVLWYYAGLKKSLVFKIGTQDIADLIGRSWLTAKRGLIALEKEGLITIQRHKGRKHLIEIRDIDDEVTQKQFSKIQKEGQHDTR